MCGAGMPCRCNRADEPDLNQIIEEEEIFHEGRVDGLSTDHFARWPTWFRSDYAAQAAAIVAFRCEGTITTFAGSDFRKLNGRLQWQSTSQSVTTLARAQ